MVLHQDALVVYGGAAGPKDCAGGVCGDAWVLNISVTCWVWVRTRQLQPIRLSVLTRAGVDDAAR